MPGATPALLTAGVLAALALAAAALALASLAFLSTRRARSRSGVRQAPGPGPAGWSPAAARSLERVGVVRFNPYHDTGGDYSFAVALLDAAGAGVLLSGLYHRDRCRVYAKPVSGWDSAYDLTDEERRAIGQARAGGAAPELL